MARTFRSLFFASLIAGVAAGGATSVVQALRLWPLIAAAELLETHGHSDATSPEGSGWSPQGALRPALTVAFNMAAGIGFALILNALVRLLTKRRDAAYTVWDGLNWGVVGFTAFALAPALGLPPVLPGMAEGSLIVRQAWWLGTAAATLGGVAMLAWASAPWRWGGVALLVLPHLIWAPVVEGGEVPAAMAAAFATGSLAASAVFWVVLGGVAGWAQQHLR